ncbi:MAG: anaerobic ribonucleoside-triphosphate reductase activating protein [Bacteroidales bacterium]|nr:anaerobic ribonucleoside-triphosphate reductase activating protein [Bacteroidales bacterium]
MNYHNITTDDMLNGDGLRVVLWVAGCEHHCKGCQNPLTWDPDGGLFFDLNAYLEIVHELNKPHISGITFSGGDPLHPVNRTDVMFVAKEIKKVFPTKTIWLYTGYEWEDICNLPGIENIDVIVDGKFKQELADVTYPWAGSTNQRIIDVKKSLEYGCAIKHRTEKTGVRDEEYYGSDSKKCC